MTDLLKRIIGLQIGDIAEGDIIKLGTSDFISHYLRGAVGRVFAVDKSGVIRVEYWCGFANTHPDHFKDLIKLTEADINAPKPYRVGDHVVRSVIYPYPALPRRKSVASCQIYVVRYANPAIDAYDIEWVESCDDIPPEPKARKLCNVSARQLSPFNGTLTPEEVAEPDVDDMLSFLDEE